MCTYAQNAPDEAVRIARYESAQSMTTSAVHEHRADGSLVLTVAGDAFQIINRLNGNWCPARQRIVVDIDDNHGRVWRRW